MERETTRRAGGRVPEEAHASKSRKKKAIQRRDDRTIAANHLEKRYVKWDIITRQSNAAETKSGKEGAHGDGRGLRAHEGGKEFSKENLLAQYNCGAFPP